MTSQSDNAEQRQLSTRIKSSDAVHRIAIAGFCTVVSILLLSISGAGAAVMSGLFGVWYLGRAALALLNHILLPDLDGDYDHLPSITVSIPAYNEAGTITDTIEGILDQADAYPNDVEVVVCDDGSTDDTWEILQWLESVSDSVVAIQQENAGSAAARNNALAHGSNEIVISMDADTVLADDVIHKVGAAFRENPDAVAVGTNVGVLNPKESIWARMQVFNYLLAMELGRMFQSQLGYVLVLSGGCSAFRRDVLEDVGGWTDHRYFSDDYDLTVRIARHGKVVFRPDINAYTDVPTTLRALWKQRLLWRQRGVTVTLVHLRKQGSKNHGTMGLIGLPIRLAIIGLSLWFVVRVGLGLVSSSPIVGVVGELLFHGALISTGLMALSIAVIALVARDDRAIRSLVGMVLYLGVYRWFLLTVRFAGSIYGVYCYARYMGESQQVDRQGVQEPTPQLEAD